MNTSTHSRSRGKWRIATILAALFTTAACATKDTHYRARTIGQETCGTPANPVRIDASSITKSFHGFEKSHASDALECSIQSFNVDHPINYDIAFVELLDNGESTIQAAQEYALHAYLDARRNQQISIYVFVHGWRHNAALGSEDVARFHTILALMKSYWRDAGQPTRKVLGVYVGWRGASFREPGWGDSVDAIVAAPSFQGRKNQSDRHAERLQKLLLGIEDRVQAAGDAGSLVVIGHSLGGNMVLRATSPLLLQRLEKTPRGSPVAGFGSLVVLINPASELSQWMTLQRASRLHAGIGEPDRDSYLAPSECSSLAGNVSEADRQRCALDGTAWVYPPVQSPLLVSLTASEHFKKVDAKSGTTDFATSVAFPLSQYLFKWPRKPEDLIALGHALPLRAFGADGLPDHDADQNRLYGITHEIEVNRGSGESSTYGKIMRAAKEENIGFCAANRRLIRASILEAVMTARRKNPQSRGRGWNQEQLWLDTAHKRLELNVKHQAARGACAAQSSKRLEPECAKISNGLQVPRLGDIHDPYWNVGVHPNLIEGHGRYVSQNLWCFVHGLATP